jgi:hypothetical protein
MGGNGGGNGGGGNGGSNVPGTPIVPVTRAKPRERKRKRNILEYSPTYQAIKFVAKTIKNIGTGNKTVKSGDTYGGRTKYGYNERAEKSNYVNRSPLANRDSDDRGNEQNNNQNINSEVQPKVASQMDAVKPDIKPIGPTAIEMSEDEKLLKRKRKKRRKKKDSSLSTYCHSKT